MNAIEKDILSNNAFDNCIQYALLFNLTQNTKRKSYFGFLTKNIIKMSSFVPNKVINETNNSFLMVQRISGNYRKMYRTKTNKREKNKNLKKELIQI